MDFFRNLRIGVRLAASFGFVLVLLLAVVAVGVSRLAAVDDELDTVVNDRYPDVLVAQQVQNDVNIIVRSLTSPLIEKSEEARKRAAADIEAARKRAGDGMETLGKRLSGQKARSLYAAASELRLKFVAHQKEYLALVAADKERAAEYLAGPLRNDQVAYLASLEAMVDAVSVQVKDAGEHAARLHDEGRNLMLGLGGLAFVLAALGAWIVTRSITLPLQRAMRVAETVAAGDLSSRIDVTSRDETGKLLAEEIKTLIGDSVEKVEAGSRLAGDAGRTMEDIVSQVARVNDLIAEISAATTEQTTGIGQVSHAVSQLDQVTQQNAALVEESAAAADSLRYQAETLVKAVSAFRLQAAHA